MMQSALKTVRPGLVLALLTLIFGLSMGIAFGVNEDGFQAYIAQGINAHPQLHDAKSPDKIWRFAQRAHFHATGIGAFTLGLILLTGFSGLDARLKRLTAILIGAGGLYPLGWFSIFLLAPGMGRDAAHEALITKLLVYAGTGALVVGLTILFAHLLFGFGASRQAQPGEELPHAA